MVRIHVKQAEASDEKEFLYDCTSTLFIHQIAFELVRISNLQSVIHRLVLQLEPRLLPFHGDPKVIPLIRALSEAKSYASMDQVIHNRPLSYYVLNDYVQSIERELKANFDLLGFTDSNQYQQFLKDLELLREDSARVVWAAKELMRDKQLCHYVGSNEKTKITVELQSPG